jgi:hypothetical protein
MTLDKALLKKPTGTTLLVGCGDAFAVFMLTPDQDRFFSFPANTATFQPLTEEGEVRLAEPFVELSAVKGPEEARTDEAIKGHVHFRRLKPWNPAGSSLRCRVSLPGVRRRTFNYDLEPILEKGEGELPFKVPSMAEVGGEARKGPIILFFELCAPIEDHKTAVVSTTAPTMIFLLPKEGN